MSIKLNAQSGGSVALDAPTQTTSSADVAFKLPVADGSANQVLKTDGSGNLSFGSAGKLLQMQTMSQNARINVGSNTGTYFVTGLTLNITPVAASSKILVLVQGGYYIIGGTAGAISIFRGGTNIGHSTHGFITLVATDNHQDSFGIHTVDAPSYSLGDTLTYDVRIARLSGSDNIYGPVADATYATSRITLIEVAA
jgi:hypothetical protein|tara:strand:- start:2170 stop:2760 length:591 start_codon:yes stop_codon:yes gene_type:complete